MELLQLLFKNLCVRRVVIHVDFDTWRGFDKHQYILRCAGTRAGYEYSLNDEQQK